MLHCFIQNIASPHSALLMQEMQSPNDVETALPIRGWQIDVKRLPKAIQAILSTYRGVRISSVPEKAIPDVLRRLAEAAEQPGRMPHQGETADVYEMLAQALKQVENS